MSWTGSQVAAKFDELSVGLGERYSFTASRRLEVAVDKATSPSTVFRTVVQGLVTSSTT